jgi:hypothetical protein
MEFWDKFSEISGVGTIIFRSGIILRLRSMNYRYSALAPLKIEFNLNDEAK